MNQSDIKTAFADICNLECNDGVVFDDMSIVLTEIKKEGNYSGIRVKFSAKLDSINQSMQIDIGFGDVVVPGPIEIAYPTLIESESPKLLAYSIESVVAEKFQAMIDLEEYNSRMKDFYDIYNVLNSEDYALEILKESISKTFEKRNTKPVDNHAIFTEEFFNSKDRINQWKAFLRKFNMDLDLEF